MQDDFDGLIRRRKLPVDAKVERQIITGMIVSDRFVREVQPLLHGGKFQTDFTKQVAEWCSEYWIQYGKAPGKQIEDLFLKHQKNMQEDQAALIEDFLAGISDEYERGETFNVEYILDTAEDHFRLTGLKALNDEVNRAIKGGRPEEGEALVRQYQRPERLKAKGVDPLRDSEFIIESTKSQDQNPDVILTLPGALGQACGPLERGFLMAFQAESGVGKTWWLWFLARLAVFAGLNTALISLEMKEKKMARRMWQDLSGSPTRGDGTVLIPVFDCQWNQNNSCDFPERTCKVALLGKKGKEPEPGKEPKGYVPCTACRDNWYDNQLTSWWRKEERNLLDPAIAIKKYDSLMRTGTMKKAGKFHLVEFPTDSLTVDGMIAYLNNLEYYDDFILDFLLTDYADKFKLSTRTDFRHAVDQVWAAHKGFGQEKHCLVATASQSNTERSGKKVGKASWAESIEKRRGIDLGIAMNQTPEQREKGLIYLSIDKMRHEEMVFAEVAVLQQLAIGRPYIDSCFVKKSKEKK